MDLVENKNILKKLGFNFLDTAQLVEKLNALLANYHVHYYKLRNFHWNVESQDFFELHDEFEKEYNAVQKNIDIIAERIRVFGIKPSLTLTDIIEFSEIKEIPAHKASSIDMVKEVLRDYNILHNKMLDVVNASIDIGDNVTEHIMTDFMQELEKRNWMFTSWLK